MNYQYQPTCQIPPETLDRIFTEAFGVKTDGRFVEGGAHDGWHWSCTWGLAEIGWKGLYIEPEPKLFAECQKTNANRPNVNVVNCCIGNEDGTNTLGQDLYGACHGSQVDVFTCKQYKLDTLLWEQNIPPRFDLLVIDVEYMEPQVLSGFTCALWMPKVIIIERPPANEFESLGYVKVFEDWINTIYVRKD